MTPQMTCVLLSVLWSLTGAVVACRAENVYNPPDCGTTALFMLMKLEGMAIGLNKIQGTLPPPHDNGYSMLELQSAARRCGLKLVGERFVPASVPLRGPAIAYRPGHKPASGHFVVLRPVGSNNTVIQVIDPPYAPQVIEYRALFGGDGRPVMILRPTTSFERWTLIALVMLLALFCLVVLRATGWIRRRARWRWLCSCGEGLRALAGPVPPRPGMQRESEPL